MASEEDVRYAESEYNLALAALMKCIPGKAAFNIESKYRESYQALVRLGVKPQLRLKYRQ